MTTSRSPFEPSRCDPSTVAPRGSGVQRTLHGPRAFGTALELGTRLQCSYGIGARLQYNALCDQDGATSSPAQLTSPRRQG